MKTDFQQWGGADPEMINRALEAQGSTYRVPVAPKQAPAIAAPSVQPPQQSQWVAPQNFDEESFQREIRANPWYTEFEKKNGGPPNLEDPDYDYRSAWAAGIRPQVYKHDGTYHWSSSLPNGQMLKSERHPTAWMEHFMRATGKDPNDIGVKSEAEGKAYLQAVENGVDPSYVLGSVRKKSAEAPTVAVKPHEPAKNYLDEGLIRQRAQEAGVNPDYAVDLARAKGNLPPTSTPYTPTASGQTPAQAAPAAVPESVPPAARMSLAQPQMAPQQYAAGRRPGLGGGSIQNPLPGMLKEASSGKAAAETERDRAETGYDIATESRRLNAETLGDLKADSLASVAEIQARDAEVQQDHQNRLQMEADSHTAATDKVNAERSKIGDFINSYEPKDRRTGAQRVAGAIAVGLSGALDQNNLVAGLMQGMNVQTSNADRTASLIQRGIDRDLEYQRALLENKQTAMAGKTTELGQLREKFGDTVDTLKLGRAMKIEQAQKEIEALMSRGASEEARILGQEASDKLEQEKQGLYSQVYGKRFEDLRTDEQKLRLTQYEQQRRAAMGSDPMKAAKYQSQLLDNEKKRRELANGKDGGPATEGERKTYGVIAGAKDSFQRLYQTVYNNDGTQKNPDDVDMPANAWKAVPSLLTPEEKEQQMLDDTNLTRTLLRIESGSNVPDSEVEGKMHSTGLTSSDESIRARARKTLLDQIAATDQWGLLDDAKPNPLVRAHGEQ